jgi:predicted MFS family arabinose efflux permease
MRNRLLATGDGRRLILAQLLDALGSGVSLVALPWLVLDHGAGAAAAGLIFAASTFPYTLFGLPAGVAGDRRPRRRMMMVAHLGEAAAAALIPLVVLGGIQPPVALALLAAVAVGAGRVYADAAAFGAIADLVGPESFAEGQAALSTAWAAGLVVGPLAGGALVAALGPASALAVESASFLVAALLVRTMRSPMDAPHADDDESPLAAMRAGIDVVLHTPAIRLLTEVTIAWNLAIVGADALIVPFLRNGVGLSAAETGWVLGAGGITGVIAGPGIAWAVVRFGARPLIATSIVLSGIAAIALALSPGIWAAIPANVAFALSGWMAVTSMIGERQRHAPAALQARVGITGRMVAITSQTVAALGASALASVAPLRALYVAFGVAALLVAAWAVPALRRTVPV